MKQKSPDKPGQRIDSPLRVAPHHFMAAADSAVVLLELNIQWD